MRTDNKGQRPAEGGSGRHAAHLQSVTCPDHRCQFMGECYAPADCKSGAPATQPAEPSDAELDALMPSRHYIGLGQNNPDGWTREQVRQAMRAALAKFGGKQ
jgi:hypothetical protein